MNRTRPVARLATALAVCAIVGAPMVAGAHTDAEAEREEVNEHQERLADELDALEATDEEVDAALDELDAAIAAQQHAVDDAIAAAEEARRAQAEAEAALTQAREDIVVLEAAITEMAVAAYVHSPIVDVVHGLEASSLSEAVVQQVYLDARAGRDLHLLERLEEAEQRADARASELADAARRADVAVEAVDAELAALGAERHAQARFASALEDRINVALGEAAALADLDAELAAQIAKEQQELIDRLPPPTTTTAPSSSGDGSSSTTAPPDDGSIDVTDGSGGSTGGGSTTTTSTSVPDGDGGDRDVEEPPLEWVRGFQVHADIADAFGAMLDAAEADGFIYGGSAYRSTQRQIELRRAHCGTSDYDVWEKPASQCHPPTAKPGTSMHEQGKAIDFTYDGHLITSRDDPGFRWLADHAGNYGFYNLPSEAWHWSTTGG